jgi:ABC-type uncharacterized transport system permease subunit
MKDIFVNLPILFYTRLHILFITSYFKWMIQACHHNKPSAKSIKPNKHSTRSKIKWGVFEVKKDRILSHLSHELHFQISKNIFLVWQMILIMMNNMSLSFSRMTLRQNTIHEKGNQMHISGINTTKIRRIILSH